MRDIEAITPIKVYLDLPTRVARAEEEFFRKTGNWEYQLELCMRLQTKCAIAAMREMVNTREGIVASLGIREAIDLVERMDALILKGIQKTEDADRLAIGRR